MRAETILVLVVGILILGALFYVFSQRQQALRSSPAGFDGLQVWLASQDVSVQTFTGGWPIERDTVGLAIVPIFDTVLDTSRTPPTTREELLFQEDEYDLLLRVIEEKRARAPTLVVLPKWRSGMRLTGIAHPALLTGRGRLDTLLQKLTGDPSSRIRQSRVPFLDFDGPAEITVDETQTARARIYAAQLVDVPGCAPVIGQPGAILLARCPLRDATDSEAYYWLLSDPDAISNHGLRLGDNAVLTRDLVKEIAGDKLVLIDYSTINWLVDRTTGEVRERTWADLKKFFAPPFASIWVAAGLLLTMALWRSVFRFGPVHEDTYGQGTNKTQAVAARARLMRLTDQDGAMLSDYAKVRIATASVRIFGAVNARHYTDAETFLHYVKRRHPTEAVPLTRSLNAIQNLPHKTSASRGMQEVDELERVLERIAHVT